MNLSNFKPRIWKLILGCEIYTYFFSQSGEDAILLDISSKKLSKKENGFYVDVGAYHPSAVSSTYLFYMNGWTGINIDARLGSMNIFKRVRDKDINIEMGISNSFRELTYYFVDNIFSMNSFSKEHLESLGLLKQVKKGNSNKDPQTIEVLDKYLLRGQSTDFLNIDVEGSDQEVLF
jgi:hypothetical protein